MSGKRKDHLARLYIPQICARRIKTGGSQPGPIRAELTFIATRPSPSALDFGTVGATGPAVRGVRRRDVLYLDAVAAPGAGADSATEAREVFRRLGLAVTQGGLSIRDVVSVTVYLSDVADMSAMNTVFREVFPTDPPARVTIQVQPQTTERIRVGVVAAK